MPETISIQDGYFEIEVKRGEDGFPFALVAQPYPSACARLTPSELRELANAMDRLIGADEDVRCSNCHASLQDGEDCGHGRHSWCCTVQHAERTPA